MQDLLGIYTEEIKRAFGDQLKSVVLYGSKASGDASRINSDQNILIIVRTVLTDQLAVLSPGTKKWIKAGNPPPLIFTDTEFATSADVFPVEFLDMKQNNKLLYGANPLSDLKVSKDHLRHEIEFDLRSRLLKLRQNYQAQFGDPKALRELMMESIPSFLVLFRNTVALLDEIHPLKKIDSLNILSKNAGLNQDVFKSIYAMRQGNKEALKIDPAYLMGEYMEGVEKIIKIIDNLFKY